MSSKQRTVDFILEQVAAAGTVSAKKMFGEYGLYCDGKMVALVYDDQLFVKPTPEGKRFVGDFLEKSPYPGAKPCLLIAGDKWDEHEWMAELIRISTQHLPVAKKKASRKPR